MEHKRVHCALCIFLMLIANPIQIHCSPNSYLDSNGIFATQRWATRATQLSARTESVNTVSSYLLCACFHCFNLIGWRTTTVCIPNDRKRMVTIESWHTETIFHCAVSLCVCVSLSLPRPPHFFPFLRFLLFHALSFFFTQFPLEYSEHSGEQIICLLFCALHENNGRREVDVFSKYSLQQTIHSIYNSEHWNILYVGKWLHYALRFHFISIRCRNFRRNGLTFPSPMQTNQTSITTVNKSWCNRTNKQNEPTERPTQKQHWPITFIWLKVSKPCILHESFHLGVSVSFRFVSFSFSFLFTRVN